VALYRTGWNYKKEDRAYLHSTVGRIMRVVPRLGTYAEPRFTVDQIKTLLFIRNQLEQGSCTGASMAYLQRLLKYIASGGKISFEFSMKLAYLLGQKECGLFGQDNGATIDGSVRAAKKYGNCDEKLCPYTPRYTMQFSQEAVQAAEANQIKQHEVMRSYDDVRRVIGSGIGVVQFGVMVTQEFMRQAVGVIPHMKGRVVGGHAMAGAYLDEKETDGRPWIGSPGTWGTKHGNQGWNIFHPDLVEQWCRDSQSEVIAITDMEVDEMPDNDNDEYTGRTVDFTTHNPF
jgi:hypothetical protein